jgi:hypothetical protein
MEKKKTLREKVNDDKLFIELYQKVGLPVDKTISFPAVGKNKTKRNINHTSLGMTRQYSKYLRGKGIVFNSK